jgi:hypothetical protein
MREMIARRASRLAALAMAFAVVTALGGCGSLAPNWDPTDVFDFLDTKKRAPGERKPVFPEGVPGITQGVPRDMVRGSAESRAAAEAQAAAAAAEPPPQPAPPPTKRARTAAKQPPGQSADQVEIAPDDVNVEDEPPPPPRRQAQRPQRAPQQVQPQQQANPFPAPLPR